MQEEDFTLDEWGLYIDDCYASNIQLPLFLCGHAHIIAVEQSVRNAFPNKAWLWPMTLASLSWWVRNDDIKINACWSTDKHVMLRRYMMIYHGSSTYMVR